MAKSCTGFLLLAAHYISCSGAVVGQTNLRSDSNSQAKMHSESVLHIQSHLTTFSENLWNNTMTRLMQNEVELTKPKAPRVDKVMYMLFAMMFGLCGCDRCFMGQICLGCLKCLTGGGFLVWAILDYCVAIYSALAMHNSINMMGYRAEFKPTTTEGAWWVAVVFLILNTFWKLNAGSQVHMQVKQQKEHGLDVPMHHHSLTLIPTPFAKALRKAGIVHQNPTVPELIAAFEHMDKDGDGQLDREEVSAGMKAMGATEEDINGMVQNADTDRDGKISKREFLVAANKKQERKDSDTK